MERTPSNNQVSKEPKENDMSTLRTGHVKEKIEIFEGNKAESDPKKGLLKKTFECTKKSFAEKQKNNAKDEMNEEIFEENKEGFTKTVVILEKKKAKSEPKIAESAQDKQESEAELAKNETSKGHVKRMKEKFENKTDESKQETACGHSEDRSSTYNTGLPRSTLDLPGHGTQGSSYSYSEAAMSPHASLLPPITSLTKNETNEAKNEMNKAPVLHILAEQHEQEIRELKKKYDELEKKIAIQRAQEKQELKRQLAEQNAQEKQEFKRQLEELEEKIEKYKETAKKELSEEELEKKLEEFIKTIAKNEPSKDELEKKIEEYKETIAKNETNKEAFMKKLAESEQEKQELQKEIDRRKAQYKSGWKNSLLYADWRKEEFKAVTVTLDTDTAHPALHLSENGRRVTWRERGQDLPSSIQRFESLPCVLGQLHISWGRCYWEVEVGNAHSWDLGVCRDNVARKGRITMSPLNGFWAIRLYSGEYWAVTSPETLLTVGEKPLKVGIFLNYEDGDVSFFNMTDGSHIFSFPKNTFHGVLRPLFRLWSSDSGSLSICPGEGKELTDVVIPMLH